MVAVLIIIYLCTREFIMRSSMPDGYIRLECFCYYESEAKSCWHYPKAEDFMRERMTWQ
jgi:hypothetical protein